MENGYIRLLAHSAANGLPEQGYRKHIEGTCRIAEENVSAMAAYAPFELSRAFKNAVMLAACYHDLGKLVPENQEVLHGIKKSAHLPFCHWDAGVAYLFERDQLEAALLVKSHHAPGLPSLPEEFVNDSPFRSTDPNVRQNTDMHLNEYISLHRNEALVFQENDAEMLLPDGLSRRLALSCLVDADYTDSSGYQKPVCEPRWEERLAKLDAYVDEIYYKNQQKTMSEDEKKRNELRNSVYKACRSADIKNSITYCDSPVGSGKTTAIMAYLLKSAIERNLRHIIVVLPFTNIISQSVEVYRQALVLDGENPEYIVAEHDHQADFSSLTGRRLASLWNTPIVVTTAVQFFETLGGNTPARLRKLHELPGSGIFIDESHAAIPAWLWPQAWNWLKLLATQWGCHIVLSSGTTSKFWDIPNFLESRGIVPPLLPDNLRNQLESFEQRRVNFRLVEGQEWKVPVFNNIKDLISFILSKQGPRLVIMNTVYGAAYLAQSMKSRSLDVLHLSTALTPNDRKVIIEKIKMKLNDKTCPDWTLVATSCIESGMDFSFRNGFSQLRSVQSFLQASGRVSRNGEYNDAAMYCFSLQVPEVDDNPYFRTSEKIFDKMIQENLFDNKTQTELVTECMKRELQEDYNAKTAAIMKYERLGNFPKVAELFVVIEDDTVMVVIDPLIIYKLESGLDVFSTQLIQNSVRIPRKKAESLEKIIGHTDLYKWHNNGYDPEFLGYMKAMLK